MRQPLVLAIAVLLVGCLLLSGVPFSAIRKVAYLKSVKVKSENIEPGQKNILGKNDVYLEDKEGGMDMEEKRKVGGTWSNLTAPKEVNPGCKERKVQKYKAPDTGKTYIHPSVIHYAKLATPVNYNELSLNFRDYISVMSVYKFLKPDRLIFHTYTGFSGKYWNKIQDWKDIQVEVNVIPRHYMIGGKPIIFMQHHADYVKLNMVHKYGGTALDFDVIMINGTRWKNFQSKSECVLEEQSDFINGGLYSCIKNSSFIAKWLEGYHRDYRPNNWLYNASFKPRNILSDENSDRCYNVHVDKTVCHNPSWSLRKLWLRQRGVEWRSKTAAHYYVKEGIPNDGEGLLTENFSLAELVQYVYRA